MLSPAGTLYNLKSVKSRLQALPRSDDALRFFSKRRGANHYKGEERQAEFQVVDFSGEVIGNCHKPSLVKRGWVGGGVINDQ